MLLKGNRLQDMEIKQNTMMLLLAIPKSHFKKCCGQWKDHRNNCVVSVGTTLKGVMNATLHVIPPLDRILFD